MDLRKNIMAEHNKPMTDRICAYVGEDPSRFRKLVELFQEGDPLLSQRAGWPMGDLGVVHPVLARPYLGQFVKRLKQKNEHPAVARNILRILAASEIPEKLSAEIFDLCTGLLMSEQAPVASRAISISIAGNICKTYPDLGHELKIMLRELIALPQTPAIRQKALKALKSLA